MNLRQGKVQELCSTTDAAITAITFQVNKRYLKQNLHMHKVVVLNCIGFTCCIT